MSRVALWLVALLLVGLSAAALVEEVLVGDPGQGLLVPGLFSVLSLLTAVGLVRRVQIARPVASVLYLLVALGAGFQFVVAGAIVFQADPFNWGFFGRFFLSAVLLLLVVASLRWLTKRSTVAAFRYGVEA
ncbi:hypothetical protein C7S18_06235 [Ahniella affigens]|uniref:Uncharacterized protein n=1 Tax=Ahniella affigens TaxID=2021234 RepID=A0A2P1PPR7_9GAMM|nr:hypothetical protein [Ahniella affigens]AVP96824.1 hypothetical protein C7S18_06235 [Ahniella affigens]